MNLVIKHYKELKTIIHLETGKVIQYKCFGCGANLIAIAELKDKGSSTCPYCKTAHNLNVFKNNRIGIRRVL